MSFQLRKKEVLNRLQRNPLVVILFFKMRGAFNSLVVLSGDRVDVETILQQVRRDTQDSVIDHHIMTCLPKKVCSSEPHAIYAVRCVHLCYNAFLGVAV